MVCRVPEKADANGLDAHSLDQAWFDRRGKDDLCMGNQGEEGQFWLGIEAEALALQRIVPTRAVPSVPSLWPYEKAHMLGSTPAGAPL